MNAERELVEGFASNETVTESIRMLVGGVTATELKGCALSPPARSALIDGLSHPHPRVRWWCIQIFDHVEDDAALRAVADCLDDPVARVRRNAVHALTCERCKPSGACELSADTVARLREIAVNDPSAKVRAEARHLFAA